MILFFLMSPVLEVGRVAFITSVRFSLNSQILWKPFFSDAAHVAVVPVST